MAEQNLPSPETQAQLNPISRVRQVVENAWKETKISRAKATSIALAGPLLFMAACSTNPSPDVVTPTPTITVAASPEPTSQPTARLSDKDVIATAVPQILAEEERKTKIIPTPQPGTEKPPLSQQEWGNFIEPLY